MCVMSRIEVVKGDITKCEVDAIVNAANKTLLGGGGVDGAIHRAAGKELLEECRTLNGCETGQAKITKGYKLTAKHVIHTVGPIYSNGTKGEPEFLASCYSESLKLATKNKCDSIAFPAISCGVYGYPLRDASKIAINTVIKYLESNDVPDKVVFVLFGDELFEIYNDTLSSKNI